MARSASELHRARVLGSPWKDVYCIYTESGRHFGKHWHDAYGFGVMDEGAHRSASGRGVVDAVAGDVITTNPGEVHDGRPHGGASRRWRILSIEKDLFWSMAGARGEIAHPVIRHARLASILRRLFRRIEKGDRLASEESLTEACTLLLTSHGTAPAAREAPADMRRVRERLAEELIAPPSLAALAAMAGLSRYQVLRRFEKVYGLPPHAWLRQQRAERARSLIRDGLGLSEAAMASGFADQSHMTRAFTRQFGFTPGAWRAALQ